MSMSRAAADVVKEYTSNEGNALVKAREVDGEIVSIEWVGDGTLASVMRSDWVRFLDARKLHRFCYRVEGVADGFDSEDMVLIRRQAVPTRKSHTETQGASND